MKAYIGIKIILAEPMDDIEFGRKFKQTVPEAGRPAIEGYHVKYSNPDGTEYDSWSPKNVFERSYREISEDEKKFLS